MLDLDLHQTTECTVKKQIINSDLGQVGLCIQRRLQTFFIWHEKVEWKHQEFGNINTFTIKQSIMVMDLLTLLD